VEILTGKHPKPSRDWLNPRLGFIRGARARAKVRQWFRKESFEENLAQGREAVEAELKRMGYAVGDLEGIPARFSLTKLDDLYVAVGSGDLTAGQVAGAVERQRGEAEAPTAEDLVTRPTKRGARQPASRDADDIVIEGVGNLLTTMAKCCQPVPGDPIVGYVTRGRGVTIHREDCGHVLQWRRQGSPRLLQVSWGGAPTASYAVKLALRAYDRRELIRDISGVLAAGEVHVTDISSRRDDASGEVSIHLTIRVRDHEQLSELLSRLGGVPNVIEARRLRQAD